MDTLKVHTCMHHNNTAIYMTLCPMIIHAMFCHSGMVILSPSGVAPVCSGDELELTCTTTRNPLQWRFSVIRGDETTATEIRRSINSIGPVTSNLTINSTVFNFSRISAPNSMPVTSRLVISPVSNGLNGTVMSCVDVDSGEVASTTIIVGERGALQGIVQLYSYSCHTVDMLIIDTTYNIRERCYRYYHYYMTCVHASM